MNPKADAYLAKAGKWQKELRKLREILLDSELTEDFKWAKPCYTFQGANLIVLCELKEAATLGFMRGALLKDAEKILTAPGENSQSMRWAKFTSVSEIAAKASILKAYIRETIAAEKAGMKVEFKKTLEPVPEELQRRLDKNAALKKAFTVLTPGRQRGYILYFSGAKQSKTREARIEKCMPDILKGKGMHD